MNDVKDVRFGWGRIYFGAVGGIVWFWLASALSGGSIIGG
jgi:hypothetical protein